MNAYKQGFRQGELYARDGWFAFKKSADVRDVALTPEIREAILEQTERPMRRFLPDREWDAFRKGFHKGHVKKTKTLIRGILPAAAVKRAPQISVLLDAIKSAEAIDARTVEGSSRRLRDTFRVTMAGTQSVSTDGGKRGHQAGALVAQEDWVNFEQSYSVEALALTRLDLTEKAFNMSLHYQGNQVHPQAHMDFAGAFEGSYSARLNEKIKKLVPGELRAWSAHLIELIRALGLDQPQQPGADLIPIQ